MSTLDTLAASVLAAVIVAPSSLDITAPRDRDHHLLFGNEVLISHSAIEALENLGASIITEALDNFFKLLRHNCSLTLFARKDGLVLSNELLQLGSLIHDLLAL